MTARIRTTAGWFTGKLVESIVRREYGRTAEIRWSSDRNSPEVGLIVRRAGSGGSAVLDRLIVAEGDRESGSSQYAPKSVGDHVHYVVHPFNLPDTDHVGTVMLIEGGKYYVYWDHVDRSKYPPTPYADEDLVPAYA